MTHVPFKGASLGEYVAGKERIETLRFFIRSTTLEQQAEEMIEQSKTEFLSNFARRRLTREQRNRLIENYRKISSVR